MVETIERKTCYYDRLGVNRKATNDELKAAYKAKALQLHPDKNPSADAKVIFQELSEAYKILSDPNERAWYDSHRDDILSGNDDLSKENRKSTAFRFNIWPFFRSDCFAGFGSGEKDFFHVYAELFERINKEEHEAYQDWVEYEEQDEIHDFVQMPTFGHKDTELDDVEAFYEAWSAPITYKTFSYADEYNPNQAPNRWTRRIIDKENKQFRGAERKEYLKVIKELVDFVKRRDPRYLALTKRAFEKQYAAQSKKDQARQQKQKSNMDAEMERWAELERERDANLLQADIDESKANENLNNENDDDFLCQICDKIFRSSNQLKTHEQTNKHKKMLKSLIDEIALDEEKEAVAQQFGIQLNLNKPNPSTSKESINMNSENQDPSVGHCSETFDSKTNHEPVFAEEDEEEIFSQAQRNKKQKRKQKKNRVDSSMNHEHQTTMFKMNGQPFTTEIPKDIGTMQQDPEIQNDDWTANARSNGKKQEKNEKKEQSASSHDPKTEKSQIQQGSNLNNRESQSKFSDNSPQSSSRKHSQASKGDSDSDDDLMLLQLQQQAKAQKQQKINHLQVNQEEEEIESKEAQQFNIIEDRNSQNQEKQLNAAKLKRQKKEQKIQSAYEHICRSCNSSFETKTQLFKHLKTTGHAAAR